MNACDRVEREPPREVVAPGRRRLIRVAVASDEAGVEREPVVRRDREREVVAEHVPEQVVDDGRRRVHPRHVAGVRDERLPDRIERVLPRRDAAARRRRRRRAEEAGEDARQARDASGAAHRHFPETRPVLLIGRELRPVRLFLRHLRPLEPRLASLDRDRVFDRRVLRAERGLLLECDSIETAHAAPPVVDVPSATGAELVAGAAPSAAEAVSGSPPAAAACSPSTGAGPLELRSAATSSSSSIVV
jgi:hypothetical protein